MRSRAFLSMLAVAAASAVPLMAPSTAAAATTTQLRVADAYTFQAGNSFDHTVCLGTTELTSLSTGQVHGPFTVDTGVQTFNVFSGLGTSCAGTPDHTFNVNVPTGAASTLMLYWPFDSSMQAAVLPDDLSCVTAGEGRVVLRNGGSWSNGSQTIDLRGTPPGGAATALISGVASGDQGTTDLAAGTYADTGATLTGETAFATDTSPMSVTAGQMLVVYGFGGNDGTRGLFVDTIPLDTCAVPTSAPTTSSTTTTIAATTTTVAAAPAVAVPAQPTFTG